MALCAYAVASFSPFNIQFLLGLDFLKVKPTGLYVWGLKEHDISSPTARYEAKSYGKGDGGEAIIRV